MTAKSDNHSHSLAVIMNAQYGINRSREVPEEYGFCLRGTLASLRSLPDYLLEEYNMQFALGIPLSEELTVESFARKAKIERTTRRYGSPVTIGANGASCSRTPFVKSVLGRHGEWNIIMHGKLSNWQVRKIKLNRDLPSASGAITTDQAPFDLD